MPPAVNAIVMRAPRRPKVQFKYQLKLYLGGFFTLSHMKQGYANVTGALLNPPRRPDKLESHGKATAIKKFVNT